MSGCPRSLVSSRDLGQLEARREGLQQACKARLKDRCAAAPGSRRPETADTHRQVRLRPPAIHKMCRTAASRADERSSPWRDAEAD
jgi:hypothetical protein